MASIPTRKAYSEAPSNQLDLQQWWTADKADVHQHMIQLVKLIKDNQSDQNLQNTRHAYLYNNHLSYSALNQPSAMPNKYHVTYNVVKSCVDTVTSRLAQRELRPRVLTEKGNFTKQQRAKNLSKYLDGSLAAGGVYRLGPEILRDACIFGMGVMKVIADAENGEITYERALIDEILVDDLEAKYGNPQSLYQVRLVARDLLIEQFPEFELEIQNAATVEQKAVYNKPVVDMVEVYEGWHLGANNRHIMAIDSVTLVDEKWEFKSFPFAFMRYLNKVDSFYGQGIAEELLGTQLEINKLLRDIQRAQHLIAVPKMLIERSSKVVAAHLNNEIGSVIKYEGTKPDHINPTAMNNEVYSHVKWLVETSYEKVGVSRLSATSKKPSGLDSKPALREFNRIESERFAITEMNYKNFFEDIAKLTVEWSAELFKSQKNLSITTEDRKFIQTINWSDVNLDNDKFVTKVYLASLLPTQPAAKLQKIEEYVRAGWMDRETALQQFNHPDLDSWETLETADKEFTQSIVNDILEKGIYRAPEPEMDPIKAINFARKVYLEAQTMKAPEDRLELLLRWIEAVTSLVPDVAPPVGPSPVVTPDVAAPQAGAQPLPQSGIIPQV